MFNNNLYLNKIYNNPTGKIVTGKNILHIHISNFSNNTIHKF